MSAARLQGLPQGARARAPRHSRRLGWPAAGGRIGKSSQDERAGAPGPDGLLRRERHTRRGRGPDRNAGRGRRPGCPLEPTARAPATMRREMRKKRLENANFISAGPPPRAASHAPSEEAAKTASRGRIRRGAAQALARGGH
jgi:hypothetical protein